MVAAEGLDKPITLFYSYSHRDEDLRNRIEDHLAPLRWSGMIAEWHDRNINAGDEWATGHCYIFRGRLHSGRLLAIAHATLTAPFH
jgi:hypothetical protein